MSAINSAGCNDCANQGFCPTDILKGFKDLEEIENYLYGKKEASIQYRNVAIPLVGFTLSGNPVQKDGKEWRVVKVNVKQPSFGRDTILLKSILQCVNNVIGRQVLVLTGPNGAKDDVVISKDAALDEKMLARMNKLISRLNYPKAKL
jgi:hypothetical protein